MKANIKIMLCIMIFTLLLTGCTAKVDMYFHKTQLEEKITITGKGNVLFDNKAYKYYKKHKDKIPDYQYKNTSNFVKSEAVLTKKSDSNQGYESNDEIGGYVTFITGDEGQNIFSYSCISIFDKYPELEELNITMRTRHKVFQHNADSFEKGVLKWNLKKGAETYEDVFISYSNEIDPTISFETGSTINIVIIFIVISILFAVSGLMIYVFAIYKSNKNNKI